MASNNGKQNGLLGRTYAEALLQLAEEAGSAVDVADEVQQLLQLLQQQPDLQRLLSSRLLSAKQRGQAIDSIFQGRVSDVLYRFIRVVNDKNRLDDLPDMLTSFAKLVDERHGIVEVDAHVAGRLNEADAARVASRIGDVIGRKVVLHQYVDPDLIGGLKIQVGDQLIDGSIATQLKLMRKKLEEAGREKARGR